MPRKIRVVTTRMGNVRKHSADQSREYMMGVLDLACWQEPDIVCLPENFATVGLSGALATKAEPLPGPTTDACARRAREHRTYIVCPLTNVRDGRFYNSAVILDRSGEICGVYDKLQPVTSTADFTEVEHGMTPGSEAPVFELDFGRVGCQICFDLGFPRGWQQLADRGAELVFWPSAYDGGFPLRIFAYLHKYYVVSAVRTMHSRIINPLGEELEHTGRHARIASRVIDLDYMVCHYDFHTGIPEEMIETHGTGVTVRSYCEEGHFLVESNSEAVPLAKLIEQFGLEAAQTYHARHLPAYEAILAGRVPEPQAPPYLGREPYERGKK